MNTIPKSTPSLASPTHSSQAYTYHIHRHWHIFDPAELDHHPNAPARPWGARYLPLLSLLTASGCGLLVCCMKPRNAVRAPRGNPTSPTPDLVDIPCSPASSDRFKGVTSPGNECRWKFGTEPCGSGWRTRAAARGPV
ncbi:hypothetical protein BJ912DRAFT_1066134 [Pholiota molesta]|nr:hypothetical protein BJ912DRAFT_1066134 [Pholiota molesta]